MKMKEVCALTGLTERTIRFYAEKGLAVPKMHRQNGRDYSDYSAADVDALRTVATLRRMLFSVDEISRFTGVPAYMLQTGKQSFQSNEQQQIDFVSNVLMAHITQMEQEWAYKLFSPEDLAKGLYLKKNESVLMRGDSKSRSEFYQKMIGQGIYNQDECRALEDKSPLPDGEGQTYWMSKNYAPIKAMLKGGEKVGN